MTLVMISGTVSLYLGTESVTETRTPGGLDLHADLLAPPRATRRISRL